ncbi:MAG: DUF3054 domain-containing protein [Acidimicrobiaceae bacterium]|nr:DUF3054 domain-containing protein [Acidimicrobiaceae bacterium]
MKKYALALDVLSVLLFVGIGRAAHRHGMTVLGMFSTTWPFAAGLLLGWLMVRRTRREASTPVNGLVIVLVTVALGMTLRVLSGQGTALAFVVVALAFLTLFLVGWRVMNALATRRR